MSNIEAIIVDGVRYDKAKAKAKTKFVCKECDLRDYIPRKGLDLDAYSNDCFLSYCKGILDNNECWKRKEE